jgi:hypothetical protein
VRCSLSWTSPSESSRVRNRTRYRLDPSSVECKAALLPCHNIHMNKVNSWSCARQPRTQLSLNCKLQASNLERRQHGLATTSQRATSIPDTRHHPAALDHHTTSPNPKYIHSIPSIPSIHPTTTYQCSNTYHNLKHHCAQQSASRCITESRLTNYGIREMGRCPITLSGAFCQECSDAGADRHILKRAFPDPMATPMEELNISSNYAYPLLSIIEPPLPFVRPADVMPPTAMEADPRITLNTNNLPVVTMKSVSNPVVLTKGTYKLPDKVVVAAPLQLPAVATAPTGGTMGPPPLPVKKQNPTAPTLGTMGPPPRPAKKQKR